ncbi:isoleucine--tRNA ligase [Heliobacterium gestii]|uniref:Isoleucine--tRNA ligase n=2 Tax=Heliomicrobium gestii TaxID=2699 RepID=A0A845LAU4_HELGE|nr:isoleucyl-tRNA synthetase [Heliomicrobium gestii]MZP43887.1 isoleucine--tRNA ligase [Heliomicrobium gestii]
MNGKESPDYSKTLNLPQTEFPMRANLPKREPDMIKFWEEIDLYREVAKANAGKPKFILHDGPPYANGDIHLGHTLNKVLKDFIVKFHSMDGYDAPYVPGWDTHGLPIEQQAIKALGLNRHAVSTVEFRRRCQEYALKYVDIQRKGFKRLGVRGDWDHPYVTLKPEFEAAQIGVFGEMAKKGYIYKGLKPVYWCASCETALAEAEVEYADKESPSIYVKFPLRDAKGLFDGKDAYVVIWTTTPWTLPANVAVTVHPEFAYVLVRFGEDRLLVAKELLAKFMADTGLEGGQIEQEFTGKDLERLVCKHPFFERDSLVILGEHVTLEQGTGCVHTAPGHGVEDFQVGKAYNLEVISPVDNRGKFTAEGGPFAGMTTTQANPAVIEELKERGLLIRAGKIKHQYPHCWRCKHPILFRATEQWFASIDGFRKEALEAIDKVRWIPAWGRDRIYNMVADRGDWCISRQRTWGVPIPIFYCADCGEAIINDETITHIQGLFRKEGSDVWFAREADDLVPPGLTCGKCGHGKFRKETDIMDVWFDSGSSHAAVLETREDLHFPADLYLEGSDQHRGWFNSSLSTSVATKGVAPYKAVLTHGFLVDEQGRKMSKSLGNGVEPQDVIKDMGADILRLWVASVDYRNDVAASPNIMRQTADGYRKIRNTFRYFLGNIADFDPKTDAVPFESMTELDRWAMMLLHKLIQRITAACRNYEFHVVYHAVHNFCAVDMSAIYLDIIKDRLYASPAKSLARRSAQTVLYHTADALVRMLAPFISFTAEEVWGYLPGAKERAKTVQTAGWPEADSRFIDAALAEKVDRLLDIRAVVSKALETARQAKVIGHSLEAEVRLFVDADLRSFLEGEELATFFIVSSVQLAGAPDGAPSTAYREADVAGLAVEVVKAPGQKCERCWIYSEEVGAVADRPTVCPRCAAALEG